MPALSLPRHRRAPPHGAARRQRGISLLESLVSMLLLAVAVLGMLGAQLRTLAETQTGVRHAQAVRLIEDLAERIKTHPEGFMHASDFTSGWEPVPAAQDCRARPCMAAELARWELAEWKRSVAATLPLGRARVFDAGSGAGRHLGVVVGWHSNAQARGHDAAAAAAAPAIDASGAGIDCPEGLTCHFVHVHP